MAGERFPWHEDNRFELMIDGGAFFPAVLREIDAAQSQIDIELYLSSSGQASQRLISTLLKAVSRGVQVRVMLDAVGSKELEDKERAQLRDAGVELRFYNPLRWFAGSRNLHRDHRKLLVFDQRVVMVGGMGLTDEFCQPDEQGQIHWHEQMLRVEGPVVDDWQKLFERQWKLCERAGLPRLLRLRKRSGRVPAPPQGDAGLARVAHIDSRHVKEMVSCLLAEIARAEQRVWLATPYFLPNWRIRRALKRAARRGLDVRLLLCGQQIDHPAVRYAGQRYYRTLLKAGVRIHEYQARALHLKTALVDNWISLGSCNFDHWTLHWNLEANQQVIDQALAEQVAQYLSEDFQQSTEWTYSAWQQLGWQHRLQIGLWGLVNRLVMRWFGIR